MKKSATRLLWRTTDLLRRLAAHDTSRARYPLPQHPVGSRAQHPAGSGARYRAGSGAGTRPEPYVPTRVGGPIMSTCVVAPALPEAAGPAPAGPRRR